ncbi:MAG: hypothetical protein LBS27_10345 [Bifidobacteriaceae bacterium]|nr:hypothetical protein [Bifidobacteriaceae bacterium]
MERFVRLVVTSAVGFVPAAGLAAASAPGSSKVWTVVAVSLATALLVAGWPALASPPEPHSARLTLAFTAVVAITLSVLRPGDASAVLVAIALGFPAVFVRELTRPAPRPGLVRSVAVTTCGVMAVAAMSLWVTASGGAQFLDLAVLAGVGIAGACLGLGLSRLAPERPWRTEVGALAGILLAAGGGAAMAAVVVTHWWAGAAVAAACAVTPGAIWLVAEPRGITEGGPRWRDAALVTIPLAVAAVPVWAAALIR